MKHQNSSKKKTPGKNSSDQNVQQGRAAIEADKEINKQDKPVQQREKEEKEDAKQWRNEG